MKRRLCRCNRPLEVQRVSVVRNIAGRQVTIENVPALCCSNCGEVLYHAHTIKAMDRLIRRYPDSDFLTYLDPLGLSQKGTRLLDELGLRIEDPYEPIARYELAYVADQLVRSVYR